MTKEKKKLRASNIKLDVEVVSSIRRKLAVKYNVRQKDINISEIIRDLLEKYERRIKE